MRQTFGHLRKAHLFKRLLTPGPIKLVKRSPIQAALERRSAKCVAIPLLPLKAKPNLNSLVQAMYECVVSALDAPSLQSK